MLKNALKVRKPRRLSPKIREKYHFGWPEWTLLGIVLISILTIVASFSAALIKTPSERAVADLDKIAREYYTDYLYPRMVKNANKPLDEIFETYAVTGLAPTYLRQLLHYDNDKNTRLAPLFTELGCDTNATSVRIKPVAPYGPEDFELQLFWNCSDAEFDR